MKKRFFSLVLALALLLAACAGPQAAAAAMHLRKTEGTVGIFDGQGQSVTPAENLGLYSGYQVATQSESYAWIDLDSVKLTKLDQDSEVEITQTGKRLELDVRSGSLFFNVTEPLAEDETLNIRTSSLVVGIRGTCGWVEVVDEHHLRLFLLEGTVSCSVTDPASGAQNDQRVYAGERADLILRDGTPEIIVETFDETRIVKFVQDELDRDGELCERILADSGLDVLAPREVLDAPPEEPGEPEIPAAAREMLGTISYHGSPAQCIMTSKQAAAFAQVLREQMTRLEQNFVGLADDSELWMAAGLIDLGGGMPALMFGSANRVGTLSSGEPELWSIYTGINFDLEPTSWGIWEYIDGRAVQFSETDRTAVYAGHLFTGGHNPGDPGYDCAVYLFENGRISPAPAFTAYEEAQYSYDTNEYRYFRTINGRTADEGEFYAWLDQWRPEGSLAGFDHGSDVSANFWGLSPAEDVLRVLNAWAGASQTMLP